MDEKLVSVIIPTYKRKLEVVKKAIDSVMMQTYQNIEIIVVDDNEKNYHESTIIKKHIAMIDSKKIKYIDYGENRGANYARNIGIEASSGEYIAFLDDDDEWLPEKIMLQVEKISDNLDDNIGMIYCPYNFIILDKNNKIIKEKTHKKLEKGYIFDKLIQENFIGSTSCVLIKKECFNMVGKFNVDMPASQDYELYLRISKNYNIDYISEPMLNYYIHGNERISNNPQKKLDALLKILEIYKEEYIGNRTALNYKYLNLAYCYALKKNDKLKTQYYIKAVFAAPLQFKNNIKFALKILLKR